MSISKTVELICPTCFSVLDSNLEAFQPESDAAPEDGDISLCFSCLSVNTFADNVTTLKSVNVSELPIKLQEQIGQLRSVVIHNQYDED